MVLSQPAEAKEKVKSDVTRAFLVLSAATIVLYLTLAGLGAYVYFHNRNVNETQGKVIALLCNRSYNLAPIVDDVVLGLIAMTEERLAEDVATGDTKRVQSDLTALDRLQGNHLLLQDLLLTRSTPCRKTP
jgi:hypothetical protein